MLSGQYGIGCDMKALWWWLQGCWWTFPFKPRRKSPIGDGKFGAYLKPGLFESFKDIGTKYPIHIGVYQWDDSGNPVRVDNGPESEVQSEE